MPRLSLLRVLAVLVSLLLVFFVVFIYRDTLNKHGTANFVHSSFGRSVHSFALLGTAKNYSIILKKINLKNDSTSTTHRNTLAVPVKTFEKFKRHDGFDHGNTNSKLWEHTDNYHIIIRRLAYHDTKNSSTPAIVLVALHDDRQRFSKPNLYLSLSYSQKPTTRCVPLQYWIKSGKLDFGMSEFYVNYMLRTIGDIGHERPLSVAVTTSNTCETGLTGSIPVQGTELLSDAMTYGVCLHKGLFRLKDPQILIDWIELHKELGAEFITIYLQSVSEDMYRIVKPYVETGYVEVLDWSLRRPFIPIAYTRDFGQSAVINECIYRNMNRVKYLALIDVDEFIIPSLKYRKVQEILPILEEKTKTAPVSAFVFYNTFFYDNNKAVPEMNNKTTCKGMRMPLYFKRTLRASNAKIYGSHKLIVKPRAVNSAQVHFVVSHQKGFLAEYEATEEIGASHHYRTPVKNFKKTPCFYSPDVGRYVSAVLPRIEKQMCKKS